jgi:photosystem II stability/assembly factor-like uncharacterized protein
MVGYPVVGDTTRCILGSYLHRSPFVDSTVTYNARYGIGERIDAPIDSLRDGDAYPFDVFGFEAIQVSEGTQKEIVAGNPYLLKPTDTSDKLHRGMLLRTTQLMLSVAAELAVPTSGASLPTSWKMPYDRWGDLRAITAVNSFVAFASGDLGTILKTTNGGVRWVKQASGTSVSLRGIWFTDTSRGFAVGEQGVVLRTTNGGNTWTRQMITATSPVVFSGVSFSSATSGTIVGDNGSFYQSNDGGATWTQRFLTPLIRINAITYPDNNHGVFVGSLGSIFGTSDAGVHWRRLLSGIETPTAPQLLAVCFSDVNHGTVVGESGTILRTTDGGESWFPQQSGTPFHLREVRFTDINYGFAVGDQGLILGTTNGGNTWTQMSVGLASWFSGLRFLNETTGLLVGSDGAVLKTTDAGITWTHQVGGPRVPLYGVRFLKSSRGIVVGYQGFIYGTVDGGFTWQTAASGTTNDLRGIDFQDQEIGISVGDNGTILRTLDGGLSWSAQRLTGGYWFKGVATSPVGYAMIVGRRDSMISALAWITRTAILRSDDSGNRWGEIYMPWGKELTAVSTGGLSTVIAVGESGYIARSLDRGITWRLQAGIADSMNGVSIVTDKRLTAVTFAAPNIAVAVGEGGVIVRSPDGGSRWTVQKSPTTNNLNGVWTSNGLDVVAVGDGGTVIISSNGGVTWTGVATPATVDLHAIHFLDAERGTIVGDNGVVLRTVAGGVVSMAEVQANVSPPSEFELAQNYPNPFNGQTTIEFRLPRTSSVIVKLFDLLGREIATLVDEIRPQGAYRVRWDASNLPSGVYFCRLSVGDFLATKKLLLLK